MNLHARIAAISIALLGAGWASALVVGGIHLLRLGFGDAPAPTVLRSLGLAGVAAGNFVFAALTADTAFRPSERHLPDAFMIVAAAVLVCSVFVAAAACMTDDLP